MKPIKTAILKEDLYSCWVDHDNDDYDVFVTKTTIDLIVEKIKNSFILVIPKGTKYECYSYDGEELWYVSDNLGGVEYSAEWAEQHLTNIEDSK